MSLPPIRLAAVALNTTPLDWAGNRDRAAAALAEARAGGAAMVCLPELCLTGYGCEDAFHGVDVLRQAERGLLELLPATRGLVACIGLPRLHHRALFNAVAVCVDGRVIGCVAKQHLAGDGIHYEPRWFKPWTEGVVATTRLGDAEVPFGDLLFEVGGVRFGFEICEDAWVAERPGARLAAHGADLILNPSASHFALGKLAVRHRFVTEGSRAFGCAYVYANLLGNEAGRALYDGGALIAAGGAIVAQGPRLTCRDHEVTLATVDVAAARLAQARSASYRPALAEHPGLVRAAFAWPDGGQPTADRPVAGWEASPDLAFEEFTRAEALGLLDYLRKSRARGFVVSLSGGCDSAAVAALAAIALRRGAEDLGEDGLRRRLAHLAPQPGPLAAQVLTTVWQGTANSSATTLAAARAVAAGIGARHVELDVGPLVDAYVAAVGGAIGRAPDWTRDDLALQNIQARARGPSAWLIANLEDKLLLTTSNRSEAAVGYATMDGDTCGGLAPIAGIDKAFLRRWLAWLAETGPRGLGPIPALAAVVAQRSTPELRPLEAAQRSEEDLMPFPVLDRIERLMIRDKLPPATALARLTGEFPEHGREVLGGWVARFARLWCRNQWKRERFAPAFHLDDENLDPRSWCRFPILSGGFARELEEMDQRG